MSGPRADPAGLPWTRAEAVARFRLQEIGLGWSAWRHLETRFGPWPRWWSDAGAALEAMGVSRKRQDRFRTRCDERVDAALDRAVELGYEPRPIEELPLIRGLPDPPGVLLVAGTMRPVPTVAVVGARACSDYGQRMARRLAEGLAAAGVVVASGLARGIDGEAHRGALAAGGCTLAVLGSGPDRPYPREHAGLLQSIVQSGIVLTEHLPGVPPREHHFPRRNRLLVAAAQALVVVEARIRSGTFTSVRWAADLGRDVLVVPGPVDLELGEGTLQLLREGATPVGTVDHVLEALGVSSPLTSARSGPAERRLTAAEARLLALLGSEFLPLDTIVRALGEPPGQVLAMLLELELTGVLKRDATMAYGRSHPPAGASPAQPPLHGEVDGDGDGDADDGAPDELAQADA